MKTAWTKWKPLLALESNSIPGHPGAYEIAICEPLHRAVGTDPEGILHIGESQNLQIRITRFRACASEPNTTGHMAGWRFAQYRMQGPFPLRKLYVRWCITAKGRKYQCEGELLKEYLGNHFELPPLNYKFNWSESE